jgi:hypothetical protein
MRLHSSGLSFLKTDHHLDPPRKEPFQGIERELKFPQ